VVLKVVSEDLEASVVVKVVSADLEASVVAPGHLVDLVVVKEVLEDLEDFFEDII
jgi:hypothetical protein